MTDDTYGWDDDDDEVLTPGIYQLAAALRAVQLRYGLDHIQAAKRLDDGCEVTIHMTRDRLSFETEHGQSLAVIELPMP